MSSSDAEFGKAVIIGAMVFGLGTLVMLSLYATVGWFFYKLFTL